MDTTVVREANLAGPCIPIGELVRETPRFYFYRGRFDRGNGTGDIRRIGKNHFTHVVPCTCCRDHPRTSYPNGYED